MKFNIKWSESNEIRNIINDCSKTSWIMRQIWEMNLIRKWKRQRNANASKNSHCRINQKNYLINFAFVFILAFKQALDALLSNNRNHQAIHKQFCFIFILNRHNDVNFILHFNFLSFRFFRNSDRNVNCFFKKFILDFNTFCLENIEQFFIFDFNEIESSFRCFRSFFKLSQKISKSSHFRVDDIRAIMCDIINRNNHVANATLLFNFFTHANNTTDVLYQCIHENIVIIIFFNDREHFIVRAHNSTFNYTKSL